MAVLWYYKYRIDFMKEEPAEEQLDVYRHCGWDRFFWVVMRKLNFVPAVLRDKGPHRQL